MQPVGLYDRDTADVGSLRADELRIEQALVEWGVPVEHRGGMERSRGARGGHVTPATAGYTSVAHPRRVHKQTRYETL